MGNMIHSRIRYRFVNESFKGLVRLACAHSAENTVDGITESLIVRNWNVGD